MLTCMWHISKLLACTNESLELIRKLAAEHHSIYPIITTSQEYAMYSLLLIITGTSYHETEMVRNVRQSFYGDCLFLLSAILHV